MAENEKEFMRALKLLLSLFTLLLFSPHPLIPFYYYSNIIK